MKTLNDIKQVLTDKGINFNEEPGKFDDEIMIGIELQPACWSWWRIVSLNEKVMVSFLQTYSQNTGKVKKSIRHQLAKERQFEKKVGFSLSELETF